MIVAPRDERIPVIALAPRGAAPFSLSAGLGTVACHRFPRFAGVASRVSTRGVVSLASMCARNDYAVLVFNHGQCYLSISFSDLVIYVAIGSASRSPSGALPRCGPK